MDDGGSVEGTKLEEVLGISDVGSELPLLMMEEGSREGAAEAAGTPLASFVMISVGTELGEALLKWAVGSLDEGGWLWSMASRDGSKEGSAEEAIGATGASLVSSTLVSDGAELGEEPMIEPD